MARQSRPPGFDMTYRPAEELFGPPWAARIPSILYLMVALAAAALVVVGESSPAGTWAFEFVVVRDQSRVIGSRAFALILAIGSVSSLLQTAMRGIRILPDGLEYRDIVYLTIPRVKRLRWAQIDRIVFDQNRVLLDLWDGSRALLPVVARIDRLAYVLETVATARSIPVVGGSGLDELPEPEPTDS